MSVDFSHPYSYHSIFLTSGELSRSQKHEESPIGTRPIGSPAIVLTLSPRLSSVTVFHIDCGIDVSSGTHTRHALGSYLLPYSLVTGNDRASGGLIWNSWYPFTTALYMCTLTMSQGYLKNELQSTEHPAVVVPRAWHGKIIFKLCRQKKTTKIWIFLPLVIDHSKLELQRDIGLLTTF